MQYLQSELAVGQRQCLEAVHENFLASEGNFLYNTCFHLKKIKKLEDLKVLRRSPDLLNNVKIGQDQLQLIIKHILFYHISRLQPFW